MEKHNHSLLDHGAAPGGLSSAPVTAASYSAQHLATHPVEEAMDLYEHLISLVKEVRGAVRKEKHVTIDDPRCPQFG